MPTQTFRTVCNRDCPDACGLVATVEDGRLARLEGDPDHPVTRGFICSRTSQFPSRQNAPDRLTMPLLRKDGRLVPVSWEEALEEAASRLVAIRRESGPAAILHYRSGGSLGLLKSTVDYFFQEFGPVTVKRGDICSGAGDAAQLADFGHEDSHDLFDLLASKNILLWGKNPAVSSVHLLPLLKESRRRGTHVLLVDPVRSRSASLADRVIQPRPGGDFALAMAVADRLFESSRTDPEAAAYCDSFDAFRELAASKGAAGWARDADVPDPDVDALADALAARPCCIQVGWGMARRTNGSAIVRALDALAAVSGNLGIPGGGASFNFARRAAFDLSHLDKAPARTLSEPRLGAEILAASSPPVRAVWITAANPVAMLPDSATVAHALETREFVVVVESFLTDTARRAHLVLPTTTLVEEDDLIGAYGHHWIGSSAPVLAPPADVLSDLEIVQRLAAEVDAKTGTRGDGSLAARLAGTPRDWKRRLLAKVAPYGVTLEVLEKAPVRSPLAPKVLFAQRHFPTPSGRARLLTEAPIGPPEEDGYPLWLFSNSTERSQSSQWAGVPPEILTATCHPDAAVGFSDGEESWLESELGRLKVRLSFDSSQRRDTVLVPKGGHLDSGTCANVLVKARATDAGEGAAYMDCRVRLSRVG